MSATVFGRFRPYRGCGFRPTAANSRKTKWRRMRFRRVLMHQYFRAVLYVAVQLTLTLQYRSKVLVHFPRYCRGGIAVCISGLTSGKPRLTSLKTPVLPRFFAVRNTAVKNRTRWCLNSLLFPLFQR